MIGVIADPAEHDVIREFFELFKTPWEFHRRGRQYEVLLCAGDVQFDSTAKLLLFYAGRKTHFDDQRQIQTGRQRRDACVLAYQGNRIPIYGDTITFAENGSGILADEKSQECTAYQDGPDERVLARIGYDIFSEIRALLTAGQPPVNAQI